MFWGNVKKSDFDQFGVHFTSRFGGLRVIQDENVCFFVRFMCVGDLWGDQSKTSTWNKNISFWGRVPSALKTSNPVLKSTQCVCVTHKKIKTIYMKINNFSILKSKLENPSGLIDRIVVLIRLSRGNSKILRTD